VLRSVGFGNPIPVPRAFPTSPPTTPRPFDIAPNGKILCDVVAGQANTATLVQYPIYVVLNWTDELKRLVPVK
jgi:hypothetical protein